MQVQKRTLQPCKAKGTGTFLSPLWLLVFIQMVVFGGSASTSESATFE